MEAAIEEQILSLEELSNDLIAANLDNMKIKEEDSKEGFEDIVQTKLQNIINLLENNDINLDMIEDTDVDGEEHSSDAILQLLENMKSDVMSLDDKDDARLATGIVPKEDKNDQVKNIDRANSREVKEQIKSVQQIKQEDIVVKQELASYR